MRAVGLGIDAGTLQDGPPRPRALKLRNDESADQLVGADRPPHRCSLALPPVGRKRGRIPAASAFLGRQLGSAAHSGPLISTGLECVPPSRARARAYWSRNCVPGCVPASDMALFSCAPAERVPRAGQPFAFARLRIAPSETFSCLASSRTEHSPARYAASIACQSTTIGLPFFRCPDCPLCLRTACGRPFFRCSGCLVCLVYR